MVELINRLLGRDKTKEAQATVKRLNEWLCELEAEADTTRLDATRLSRNKDDERPADIIRK